MGARYGSKAVSRLCEAIITYSPVTLVGFLRLEPRTMPGFFLGD